MPRKRGPKPVSEREFRLADPEAIAQLVRVTTEELLRSSAHIGAIIEAFERQTASLFIDFKAFDDFAKRLEGFLGSLPNVGGAVHSMVEYENCTERDGIPIIWLPRPDVVNLLIAAADRETRVAILLDPESEILEDCKAIASEISHPELQALADLVMQAQRAHASGFSAAAQTLGVVLCEAAINGLLGEGRFETQRQAVDEMGEMPLKYFRSILCLWPVSKFYQMWHRSDPIPRETNRHASVHRFLDAYSREHALIAIMLATSLVREWQEVGGQDGALAVLVEESLRGAPKAKGSQSR